MALASIKRCTASIAGNFAYKISIIGVHHMKSYQLLLICLFATAHASANNSDALTPPVVASLASTSASAPAVRFSSKSAPMQSRLRHKPTTQASLSTIGGGVVKEMKATSAFVEQHAAKARTFDSWLIALAAFGLVILQLRRKHKSLPQRQIAPYA
jgi:hypothetical protein